jgi:hypothetical protein
MRRLMLALAVLAAVAPAASAWTQGSYEEAARRLCSGFGCGCEQYAVSGSTMPDLKFRDQPAHHCYRPLDAYPNASAYWSRPTLSECPAQEKASVWLSEASNSSGCERWKDIGIALHYFLDGKEFWNRVVAANRTCAGEQESEVNDYLLFGGAEWKSCSCGICVSGEDFADWLAEFRENAKPLVPADRPPKPTVVIVSNPLDAEAAGTVGRYLSNLSVNVTIAAPEDFAKVMNGALLVFLGGQNAPGVGPVIGGILTDSDKAAVLKSVFTGEVLKKTDVWIGGQTVYIIAGWGANETADAAWNARDILLEDASERALATNQSGERAPECATNADCGTTYFGPYVCSSRSQAARVPYMPVCSGGACTTRAGRPVTDGCPGGWVCISFAGCVHTDQLPHFTGLYRPILQSWVSSDRLAAMVGQRVKVVLYAKSSINDTVTCQYYGPDGWEDFGILKAGNRSYNSTAAVMLNFTAARPGTLNLTERIRCGNLTEDEEFLPMYYAEHNVTVLIYPQPIGFEVSVRPETVALASCTDRGSVAVKIENAGASNLTCDYRVGDARGRVFLPRPGAMYNRTVYRVTWSLENTTYGYLSYFSGSDFENTTYTYTDDDGVVITKNISQNLIDMYANQTRNFTIYAPVFHKNATSYLWDDPYWSESVFPVDSAECTVDAVQVKVTCQDQWGQKSAQERRIRLTLPRRP